MLESAMINLEDRKNRIINFHVRVKNKKGEETKLKNFIKVSKI